MTSKDQDTDPSTPGAMRGLSPTDPTPTPIGASAHVSTDPGVGPPSVPAMAVTMPMHRPVRTPPMGIVVPASSPVKPRKDSVELLLDGMQGPQPERPKTMPQTDGQSSASYHAEHMVRPARTSPDEEPKVVVERPLQAPTTRIDRGKLQGVIEAADARRRAMEATAVLPQQIAPRVVVAIVSAVVVVLGIFVVFRLAMGGGHTETATGERPAPAVAPAPAPAPPAPASAEPAAAVTADTPAATAMRPAPTGPASPKPKNPRASPGATAGSGDLGEFKTTFH